MSDSIVTLITGALEVQGIQQTAVKRREELHVLLAILVIQSTCTLELYGDVTSASKLSDQTDNG